ncbi:hypothetical protein ACP4OV_005787 [Aristida adscensionis]
MAAEAEAPAAADAERLRRHDSLYGDAEKVSSNEKYHGSGGSWARTLQLAFQSIGVVYGDIGTSPLYVYSSTFRPGRHPAPRRPPRRPLAHPLHPHPHPHAQVRLHRPPRQRQRRRWVKARLESSNAAKIALFTITILGTSMVMGDGTLTPAISVLSAVSGIREKAPNLTQCGVDLSGHPVLALLGAALRHRQGRLLLRAHHLIVVPPHRRARHHHPPGLQGFNPMYIVDYFRRNGKEAWVSLAGVVLCITGTEATFADLGHFNIRSIQKCRSASPGALFWPMFVVAIMAAIIASQATLSGAFAILAKALSLGCFPRVKVVHTSGKYEGQVYIPEVNFLIGAASVAVTLAFQTTANIGNAYGICVVTVLSITTHLMAVVMLLVWRTHPALVAAFYFYTAFGLAELVNLSSSSPSTPERFISRRVGPAGDRVFRCVAVARYGYTDPPEEHGEFAAFLLGRLKVFVQEEAAFAAGRPSDVGEDDDDAIRSDDGTRHVQTAAAVAVAEEQRFIDAEAEHGVVYPMGGASVTAAAGSSVVKRVVVNNVYGFLRKNLREGHRALSIPRDQVLKVGITTYEI